MATDCSWTAERRCPDASVATVVVTTPATTTAKKCEIAYGWPARIQVAHIGRTCITIRSCRFRNCCGILRRFIRILVFVGVFLIMIAIIFIMVMILLVKLLTAARVYRARQQCPSFQRPNITELEMSAAAFAVALRTRESTFRVMGFLRLWLWSYLMYFLSVSFFLF